MDFNALYDTFQKSYFTLIILFIIELLALFYSIKYIKNQKIGRLFILYIVLDFLILLSDWYLQLRNDLNNDFKRSFFVKANATISLIELTVYYYYFQQILFNNNIRILIRLFGFIYSILVLIYLVTGFSFATNRLSYISYLLGVIEFLLLIPPCIAYFHQLLQSNSKLMLFERPSFWIVTGIFFFAVISVPYYLLKKYFDSSNYEWRYILAASLFYTPFIINFVFLIKAFLCKKTLTI